MRLVRVQSKDGAIWCCQRKSGRKYHVIDSWFVECYTGRIGVSFYSWQSPRVSMLLPSNWDLAK